MSITVCYAPASHCLIMDTDTDTAEWLVFSFYVHWTLILADRWVGSFDCRQYNTVVETEVCAMVPCTDEKYIFCWIMKLCCRDFTPSTLT